MKTVLLRMVGALAVTAMLSTAAHADEATKRAKLHEMFQLAHTDQTVALTMAGQQKQIPKMLQQLMPGKTMTPQQQADVDAFILKISGIVHAAASWDKLEPQFTDIYASVYSEQEIDGLIAFYKSPVGETMVAKQPELIERTQALTQAILAEVQPQIMQAALQFAQEMQAKQATSK